MELSPGVLIADRYRVDRQVGAGGMGQVWAGEHVAIGSAVAIKTLLPAQAARADVVKRFKREAYFLGRIRSDHVARVLDFITDPTYGLVLVMEFIEGDPLSKVLMQRNLTTEEAIELAAEVASGLCDLHAVHIVHRDIKPANVILQAAADGRRRAVIVDFGVSRMLRKRDGGTEDTLTSMTKSHTALGTVQYMAPEQVLNSRDATPVSDIYAVGAMLYRAVIGGHVFADTEGGSLAEKKISQNAAPMRIGRGDELARGLEKIVDRALCRRPADRFASAREMLTALEPLRRAVWDAWQVETTHDGFFPFGGTTAGSDPGAAAVEPFAETAHADDHGANGDAAHDGGRGPEPESAVAPEPSESEDGGRTHRFSSVPDLVAVRDVANEATSVRDRGQRSSAPPRVSQPGAAEAAAEGAGGHEVDSHSLADPSSDSEDLATRLFMSAAAREASAAPAVGASPTTAATKGASDPPESDAPRSTPPAVPPSASPDAVAEPGPRARPARRRRASSALLGVAALLGAVALYRVATPPPSPAAEAPGAAAQQVAPAAAASSAAPSPAAAPAPEASAPATAVPTPATAAPTPATVTTTTTTATAESRLPSAPAGTQPQPRPPPAASARPAAVAAPATAAHKPVKPQTGADDTYE